VVLPLSRTKDRTSGALQLQSSHTSQYKPNPPRRKGIGFGSASGADPEGNRSDENEAMDEAVQEAKLLRQVNALIVAHLRGQSLGQAAAAVAAAAVAALSAADSVPSNHLLRLVAKVPPPSPSSCLGFSSAPA